MGSLHSFFPLALNLEAESILSQEPLLLFAAYIGAEGQDSLQRHFWPRKLFSGAGMAEAELQSLTSEAAPVAWGLV